MEILGLVFVSLSGIIHLYIWVLESFLWTKPATRKTFGISEKDALITKPMAFNQGFYNLFLAVVTFCGVGLKIADNDYGSVVVLVGAGSMALASVVLISSDRTKLKPALIQGIAPALGLLLLFI